MLRASSPTRVGINEAPERAVVGASILRGLQQSDMPSGIGASLMLSTHITSFFSLIRAQLEETSRGVASIHHFHNVRCGIENILCLLEYNNDVIEKADQLSRRASSYITRHESISSKI